MKNLDSAVNAVVTRLREIVSALDDEDGVLRAVLDGEFDGAAKDFVAVEVLMDDALFLMADVLRADGRTWQQVADALGVGTKQAAQQRFGS